jgi:hypothetical protein
MGPKPHSTGPYGAGRRPPRTRRASEVGGSATPKNDCCPMVAAVRAVRRGKYRLARRYTVMSVRLIASR